MIYLRTGLPGASKTLNSLVEICAAHDETRPKFYNNIKLLMLDYDVACSFGGWFYGHYFPSLKNNDARRRLVKLMKRVHADDRFIDSTDAPWLLPHYEMHNHFDTWLHWVRRCYSPKQRDLFEETLQNCMGSDAYCFESVKHFNFHFNHFDDVNLWYELPKSSIILIDEAQTFFPPRSLSQAKTPAVARFETHRHHGHDVHLVTQDSMLIDANVRRLVGRHIHFFNATGGERVTRYEVPKAFNPSDYHDKQTAKKDLIKREKQFYGVYWSAEIHTHKFKMPRFVWYFLALFLLIGLCFYALSSVLFKNKSIAPVQQIEHQDYQSAQPPVPKQINLNTDKQKTLLAYISAALSDVYIDGHVVKYSGDLIDYSYSFSNAKTGQVFYPDMVGLRIMSINHCMAMVKFDDVIQVITCNPFYTRPVHIKEEQEQGYSVDTLARN